MQGSRQRPDRRGALKLPGGAAIALLVNGMDPTGDGPDAPLETMRDDTTRCGRIMRATNFRASQ